MILVFTAQNDECSAQVYSHLRDRSWDVELVDDSLRPGQFEIRWSPEADIEENYLNIRSKRIPLDDVHGVLVRSINPLQPNSKQAENDQQFSLYEQSAALEGFLSDLDRPVINRPIPGSWGKQLYMGPDATTLVRDCGFMIPLTYIGASRDTLGQFARCLAGNAAILSGLNEPVPPGVFSQEALIEGEDDFFADDATRPFYLQELPKGELIQMYVVGPRVSAVAGGPWYMAQDGPAEPLPRTKVSGEIKYRARSLARSLNLDFAQLNMLKVSHDEWYCYDVSGFPMYSHCCEDMQTVITAALADLLLQRAEMLT